MSMMVVFVAGIITGWILEWLFFTFFVKKTDDIVNTASVAQQINESVPDDKGEANKASNQSGKAKQETKLETKVKTTSVVSDDAKSVDSAKQADKKSEVTEAAASTTPATAVKEEIKEEEKEAKSAKDGDSKVSNNKSASKKQSIKSKSAKPVTNKSNSEPTKKDVKKSTAAKKVKKDKSADTKTDDLTTLKGIGPKLAKSLSVIGINSFSELTKLKGSDIVKQLEGAGHKIINKPALDNLASQAKLAAKGDVAGLEILQKSL